MEDIIDTLSIYFIRHGKTLWNVEERYIGATDMPLCPDGRAELENKWREQILTFDAIYSSPMKRCIETSQIIFPGSPFKIEENIKERNFGIFEGKGYVELQNNAEYYDFIKCEGKGHIRNGESYDDFIARILNGVLNIAMDVKNRNITKCAIVSHGGVIMNLLANNSYEGGTIFDYMVENGGGYSTTFNLTEKRFRVIGTL